MQGHATSARAALTTVCARDVAAEVPVRATATESQRYSPRASAQPNGLSKTLIDGHLLDRLEPVNPCYRKQGVVTVHYLQHDESLTSGKTNRIGQEG
eukprot:606003-Pyramimonas_sp.AAC.1